MKGGGGGEKKTDPIPVVKKKLPHDNVFPELSVKVNELPRFGDIVG